VTDDKKLIFCKSALRIIALSYRQRIDKADTPPYVFAEEVLNYLGDNLDWNPDNDVSNDLLRGFREWRRKEKVS